MDGGHDVTARGTTRWAAGYPTLARDLFAWAATTDLDAIITSVARDQASTAGLVGGNLTACGAKNRLRPLRPPR